jgi:protein ImuB
MVPFSAAHGSAHRTESAYAVHADSAGEIVSALRRFRRPMPARVTLEHDRPRRVVTDRQGFSGGAVVAAAGPWRTSREWWASSAAAPPSARSDQARDHIASAGKRLALPWNRDEWDVALADGAVYRIFRDRDTDGWFIEGIVD